MSELTKTSLPFKVTYLLVTVFDSLSKEGIRANTKQIYDIFERLCKEDSDLGSLFHFYPINNRMHSDELDECLSILHANGVLEQPNGSWDSYSLSKSDDLDRACKELNDNLPSDCAALKSRFMQLLHHEEHPLCICNMDADVDDTGRHQIVRDGQLSISSSSHEE